MRWFLSGLVVAMFASATAQAAPSTDSDNGDIAFYAGQYSIFDQHFDSGMFGMEYRWADVWNGIRPTIGGFSNSDQAVYGYAGIYWDIPLGRIVISPGVAAGYYHKGDSKDLGGAFEFRDTIEATYRFESGQRLGLQLTHLSNASIYSDNPGVETLQIVFTNPIW